jgi:hypothetical protein
MKTSAPRRNWFYGGLISRRRDKIEHHPDSFVPRIPPPLSSANPPETLFGAGGVERRAATSTRRWEVSGFVRSGRCGSYHRRELLGCLAIYTTSSQLPLPSTGRIHKPAHILLLIPCWLIHKRCVQVQRLWNLSTSYVFRPQRPVKSVPDRHSQFSLIFICLWHTRSILKLLSDVLIRIQGNIIFLAWVVSLLCADQANHGVTFREIYMWPVDMLGAIALNCT